MTGQAETSKAIGEEARHKGDGAGKHGATGGNTTGVSILASELDVKRLEILHEFVPQARRIAAAG